MHNTMRNTIQNGISHSITSVLPIKQRISHSFSSLSKTFLIDFPSDSKYFFYLFCRVFKLFFDKTVIVSMDCNETRSKKKESTTRQRKHQTIMKSSQARDVIR